MNRIPVRSEGNHHTLKKGPSNLRITEASSLDINYHTDTESSFGQMKEAGFVVFKNLLDAEEVDELRRLMDETGGADEDHYRRGHFGKSESESNFRFYDKHIGKPFCTNAAYLKYVSRVPAIDVIELIHGFGTRLIGGSIWVTGTGRNPMSLHIDYQPFGIPEDLAADPRVQVPIMISTLHYYLNDMYMELGPTLVVEGSHKSSRVPDDDKSWNGNEVKALVCKAGDAILFRSDLWHGALPNCSDERRYMLQVHYGCAYIERAFITPWGHPSDGASLSTPDRGPSPVNFADCCDDRQRYFPQGTYVLQQYPNHSMEAQWHQK